MKNIDQDLLQYLAKSGKSVSLKDFFKDKKISPQDTMLVLENLKNKGFINVSKGAFSLGNSQSGVVKTTDNTLVFAEITKAGKEALSKVKPTVTETVENPEPAEKKESFTDVVKKAVKKAVKSDEKTKAKGKK